MAQRKGSQAQESNSSSSVPSGIESNIKSLQGLGQPLSESVRSYFEPRIGYDFSNVRVHTDHRAAESARAVNAKAFTVGSNIVFRKGEYAPETDSGQQLLAHELTHVIQQREHPTQEVVQRKVCNPKEQSCPEGTEYPWSEPPQSTITCESPPAAKPSESSLYEPVRVPHDANFDPCQVDVAALTNYWLLAEYSNALGVVSRGRDAPRYFDYRNLQRRLVEERDRRVTLGHAWLATMPGAIPEQLYRIVDGPSGIFQVLAVPGATVAGASEDISSVPLMTRAQFDRFLETHNIERIGANEYLMRVAPPQLFGVNMGTAMVTGGRLYNTPLDMLLMDPFARPIRSASGGIINKWSGRLGEAGFKSRAGSGFGYFLDDLNARNWVDRRGVTHTPSQENYPTFDFERTLNTPGVEILGVARVSAKTSLQPNQVDRFAYYREGMAGMNEAPGARSALPTYIANDPQLAATAPGTPYDVTRARVLGESYMAINADDVAAFRQLLSNPTLRETPQSATTVWNDRGGQQGQRRITGWRTVLEGVMRDNPVTIDTPGGQRTFSTPDALDAALNDPLQSNRITAKQHMNAQREVGRRAAAQVLPHNLETIGGIDLHNARLGIHLPEAQLRPLLTPEYIRGQRAGGGFGGEVYAGTGAGLQGVGVSGVIAVLTTIGVMYFDEGQHANWERELAVSGGLGSLGGGTGAASEQILISAGTRLMINDVAATGVSRLTPGLVTGMGRFGGGAVGAMFVEGISIGLLEEREHTGIETGTRLVRSGVIGGSSIWAGAALGTAVGGPIGFVVGLLVGGILYYVGDRIVPGGREDWDAYEAGCRPRPTISPPEYRELPMHWCFTSDTLVTMADGTGRRIDQLREGDTVLSYDERDGSLHPEKVLKIKALVATAYLKLRLAHSGAEIGVTGEHPLHTKGQWVLAKTLRVGSIVTCLDDETGEISEAEVAEITNVTQPTSVYDLSVSNRHTYFAGGLLAHNKNI